MLDMNEFAQMITQTWMVYVFVCTILLVALIPLYQSVFSIMRVNDDLSKATKVLIELGKTHQQEEFYNQFKAIHAQISKIRGLRHAWREFADSTYFGNSAVASKKVYLSHRPSHYFNRDSVLGKRLNLSQFLAYPNYLIGIGLTFTFIGLAAALHVAQAGLASGGGQQALKDLLAVASIKFTSSIVGITSSLFISALQRFRIRRFQQKLTTFCDLLEECTEYKSTEKLLHDSFYEQKKQTAVLSDMATNIANAIGGVLSTQLPASVASALDPMTQEMRTLAKQFTGTHEAVLKNVLEAFLVELRQGSLDDMQGLLANMKLLNESVAGLIINIDSLGKNFGSETKESTARLSQMLTHFTESFTPVQQAMGQFTSSVSSLETTAGVVKVAGEHMGSAADDNKNSTAQLGKAMAELSGHLAPLGAVATTLSQSVEKVEASAQDLKTSSSMMQSAADGFKASATTIAEAQSNISKADNDIEKSFAELAKGGEALRAGIQSLVAVINEHFSQSITGLSGSTQSEAEAQTKRSYFSKLKAKWGQ